MRALSVLDDHSLSSRRESLDRVHFTSHVSFISFIAVSLIHSFNTTHLDLQEPNSPHGSLHVLPCGCLDSHPGEWDELDHLF